MMMLMTGAGHARNGKIPMLGLLGLKWVDNLKGTMALRGSTKLSGALCNATVFCFCFFLG